MSEQTTPNAHNFQDLTGRLFGQLTVICRDERECRKIAFWKCQCSCGKECVIAAYPLTSGERTDCGCRRGERWKEAMRRFQEQNPQPTAVAIALSNGTAAIVDNEDYPLVSKHTWGAHKGTCTWYARSKVNGIRVLLHVFLIGKREGLTIDHINGNGLDNRRSNLRWATGSEQQRNIHGGRGRSLYKGVCWAVRHRKWVASIFLDSRNAHLGYFDAEEDAARAYDAAAIQHFGEFAQVNFPPNQEEENDA